MFNKVKESRMVKDAIATTKCAIKVIKIGIIICIIWGTYVIISTNMENGAENIFTAFMGDGSPSRSLTPVEDNATDSDVESSYANNEINKVNGNAKESYDERYVAGLEMISYMNDYLYNVVSSQFTDLTAAFYMNEVDMDNGNYILNLYVYDSSSSNVIIDEEVSVDFVEDFEDIELVSVSTNKSVSFKDFIYGMINIPNE